MARYLMSEDGAVFLMACFAVLSVLAFLATGRGDRLRASEMSRFRP
jgi:hypothetical protein